MKKLLLICVLLFSFLTNYASEIIWSGSSGTSWHVGSNWQGGVVPSTNDVAVFNHTSSIDAVIASNISISGLRIESGYFGTVTQSGGSITIGVLGYNQSGGSFVGGSSAISVSGYFTIDNGFFTATSGALTLSGTIVSVTGGVFFHNNGIIHKTGGGATWNITQSINNLDINTQGNFDTSILRVLGNVYARGWNTHHGIIEVEGNYTTYFTTQSTSSGKVIFKGSNNQVLSANGASGCVSSIEVNKTGGFLSVIDTIILRLDWTNISSGTNVDVSAAEIIFAYENDVTSNGMILNNITVSCPGWFKAVDKMTITGLAKFNSFNVVHGLIETSGDVILTDVSQSTSSGTLKFIGSNNQSLSANGNCGVFPNITIQKSGGILTIIDTIKLSLGLTWVSGTVDASNATFVFYGGSQTIDAEGVNFGNVEINTAGNIFLARPLKVDGNLTVTAINAISGERVEIKGDFNYIDTFFWGNGVEAYLVGSNNQSISVAGTSGLRKSIYINKTGGTVSLASDLSLNNGWQNINIINGTLDLNGFNLSLGGVLKNSGLVTLIGSETVTLGDLDNSGQGTVTYTGTGAYSSLALGDDYYHLNVAGTVTQDNQLSVLGDLNITGALNSNGHNLYLAGNFNNLGTYTSGANSVYLIGGNQVITSSNTFNNLIKRSNTTASLIFPAGSSQTVSGILELVGTAGSLLTLKSSTANSAWSINHTGSVSRLGYLNISDSTSVSTLDAKSNSVNAGNNTNWVFNSVNALVWTGAVNTNFSNAGNWVGGVAPTANDVVEFLSGSNAINIDIDANVAGIVLGASFSGSVTLAANKNLNVGYNGITILGGTFNGNTKTITSTGDFVISNGIFNSNSASVEIIGEVQISGGTFYSSTTSFKVGGNWTKSNGVFNPLGPVTFNGFGGQVITSGGTVASSDFADVNVSFGTVTIANALKVNGNLTINSGQLKSNSAIQLAGSLTNNGGFINDQTGSSWLLNGTAAQNIKLQNHVVKTIQISNTSNKVTFLDEVNANELIGDAGSAIVIEKGKFVVLSKLTLNGTAAQPIGFKSNIAQQNAFVIVSGVQTISYVDVRGIDGQYGPTLNGTNNCVDLGYNVNWAFPDSTGKPTISFTPASDIFENALVVTLTSTGTAPIIYYTLDGSTPTISSAIYSAPLNLTATTTIKAISVDGANTSIVFGKVYQAVQSAIDDGLVYPIKSYGLNSIIYLGDSRRFEGEAWHVGADNLMNTSDDYRVPEFDKYIQWSSTGGTIEKIQGTGGAIFTDDGYTSSYTVTLTLGPKSFTGCNNSTPVRECAICGTCPTSSNVDSICPGTAELGVEPMSVLPPEDDNSFPGWFETPEMMTEDEYFGSLVSDVGLPVDGNAEMEAPPTFGENGSPLSVLFNGGAYAPTEFGFGFGGRLEGLPEVRFIGNSQIVFQPNIGATGGGLPFSWVGPSNSFKRDGGNSSNFIKIPNADPNIPPVLQFNPAYGGNFKFEPTANNSYRITSKEDRNGNVTNFDYSNPNTLKIIQPSGSKVEITSNFALNGKKQITKIEMKPANSILAKTHLFEYDSNGYLKSKKSLDSINTFGYGEEKFTHDIHGNLTSFTNRKGYTSNREYDDNWRITKYTRPTGQTTTKEYSGKSGAYNVKITDPNGNITTVYRNQNPYHIQTTKIVEANGLTTEYQYENKGYVTQKTKKVSTNPLENIVTLYEYDTNYNVTKETIDPSGLNLTRQNEFDLNENKTKEIDANGKITAYTYTANRRLATSTVDLGGLNLVTSYSYNSVGELISITDPLGKIKTFEYNGNGQLTKSIDELGKFETRTYDDFGNQISYIDKNGFVSNFEYDTLNRVVKRTDPSGNFESLEYDAANYLTRFTDRAGQVSVKTYDSLNHISFIGGEASAPGGSGCGVCGSTKMNGTEGQYTYSWNGQILTFADANYIKSSGASGTTLLYQYSSVYQKSAVIGDPTGLQITTEYLQDKLGRRTEVRDVNHSGDDEITQFEFDKASRLVATKRVLGNTNLQTQYEFDSHGNKTKTIDANGNFSTTIYDGANRIVKTIDAENTEYQNFYNARSELVKTIADVNGFAQTTEFIYNDRGELIQTIQPDGGIEICEYDNNGNKTKCTDPMGGIKEWEYDNKNQMVVAIDEAGFETNFTYDNLGNLLSEINNQGTITSYIYGHKSFLEKIIEDVGGINRTTEYTRDEYGRILDTIDASSTIYRNVYNAAYRIVQTIADVGGKNITSTAVYDSALRHIKTIDAAGFETNFIYDQDGRILRIENPDGGEKIFIYDNTDKILQLSVKVNTSHTYVETYEYNKVYQITKAIEDKNGLQITTQNNYDTLHRLISLTDAKNQVTSYEYDSENRIVKEIYADGGVIIFVYDLDGRLTSKTDQAGDACHYSYDVRDLLIQQTYGIAGVKSFTYDSLERRISDTDNNSGNNVVSSTYSYDRLHRNLTDNQKIGSGAILSNSKVYNAFGDNTQITLPSGKNIYQTYTSIHQPSSIASDIGNGLETLAHYEYFYETSGTDKRPFVKKKNLANSTSIKTNYAHDALGRLTLNDSKYNNTTTLVGFEYTYDLIGNRITDKHLHRLQDSESYGYDTALRFNDYKRGTIGGTPSLVQNYTLDKLANWSSFNNNGNNEIRTHSATNEITSINSLPLNHDLKGNLTTNKNGDQYYWDKLNRLVEVRNSSNTQIALYYYNVDNLRVQKTTTIGTEQYYYSGSRVVVETDGNQTVTKEYIHGGQYIDEVITVSTGGLTYFYLYDLRFNVYALTDSNGNIIERMRYQGFGKVERLDSSFAAITTPLVNQAYTHTGQHLDLETGLQYYRARFFDNDLGRFISRDLIGYEDGLNLYRGYFENHSVDPSGNLAPVVVGVGVIGSFIAREALKKIGTVAAQALLAYFIVNEVVIPITESKEKTSSDSSTVEDLVNDKKKSSKKAGDKENRKRGGKETKEKKKNNPKWKDKFPNRDQRKEKKHTPSKDHQKQKQKPPKDPKSENDAKNSKASLVPPYQPKKYEDEDTPIQCE